MKKFIVLATAVLVLAISPVAAQEFGLFSVNPSASIVMPENHDMGFGVNVSANVGEVMEGLSIYPTVSYWTASWENLDNSSTNNIALGVDVHYSMEAFPAGMYVGAGLNYNMLTWEYDYVDPWTGQTRTWSFDDNNLGTSAFVGYTFSMGNFGLFAEARYNLISDFNNLQFSVGVPFSLK